MAHKSVTIIQKAKEQINETYLAILCKNFPLYMGLACMHEGKLTSARIKGAPTVATFKQMTEEFGNSTMMFVVGAGDGTLLDEDMQPFELLKNKDGELVAVGSLSGDFANHSVVKSSHTNEYHCVQSVLIPKLRKLYKSVGEGIPELIEELKDPVTAADFQHYWGNYGDITILTSEGVINFTAKNIRAGDFNWGRTSDALNYKEQTVAKVETKELSMLEKLKAKMGGKEPAAAPDVTGPTTATSTSAAAIVAASEDEFEMVGPAPQDLANKDKIQWWVAEVGYKPEGYKLNTTKVKRKKGTKVGVLHALAATNVADAATAGTAERTAPVGTGPQPDVMKVDPKTLPDKKDPPANGSDTTSKHVSADNLPLISPKQKIELKKGLFADPEVMKILGDDHRATLDPKLLKTFEDTYHTFTDGMGIGELDQTMNWPFELYNKLGVADVKALAILAFNYRNEMYKTKVKLRSILADPANKIATKVAM